MSESPLTMAEFMGVGGRALSRSYGCPVSTETVALSVASARNAADLEAGAHYRVVSDVDSWINLGDGTVTAATSDFPLFAKLPVIIYNKSAVRIAGIAGGAGKLYITKMEGI